MALYSKDNIAHGTLLGIWKKDESLELLESVSTLNPTEEKEYSIITNESRKKEWLITRILLTELLQRKTTICHLSHGKPFLHNHNSNISISHSRNFVSIIVSSAYYPGIDIEHISNRVSKIKHKFLDQSELKWCLNLEQQTGCWSAKESVFKIYEKELDFHDIEISQFNTDLESGRFKAQVIKKGKEGNFVINYKLIENDIITYTLSKIKYNI